MMSPSKAVVVHRLFFPATPDYVPMQYKDSARQAALDAGNRHKGPYTSVTNSSHR